MSHSVTAAGHIVPVDYRQQLPPDQLAMQMPAPVISPQDLQLSKRERGKMLWLEWLLTQSLNTNTSLSWVILGQDFAQHK